jgi:hypothetical protein
VLCASQSPAQFILPHYFSATQQDLYAKCREIFRKVRADDEMLKKHRLYYDLQSILYSLDKLEIPEVGCPCFLLCCTHCSLHYRTRPTR